jgi:hypothetical protein
MISIPRHHAEWLSLVETSGPFLSMPVLLKAFPQGLPARDPERSKEAKFMFEQWNNGQQDRAVHRGWCDFVLRSVLQFPSEIIVEGQTMPPGMEARMSEYNEVLRPDVAIVPPKEAGSSKPRLLVQFFPPAQELEKPLAGKHWKASPATRMAELLHAADVRLGLITNGEHWMLVHAPRGETTGFASWYAPLWFEEPLTFQAFTALLGVQRFFGVPEKETIEALLTESAQDQQEVTEQLGWQVRKAVEVLIQAFDRLDQDSDRTLLAGVTEKQLYESALTVMMRLVFLMCAEERKVFFQSECKEYTDFYAVSTLRDQLQEIADKHVEEILDTRFDAWSRLLATCRAVYAGVRHETMRLPPYGGNLFNPDRFPFLEGRKPGTDWRTTSAEPLKVSNRTVLHLLNALQILQVKVPGGGAAEARRLSFRALDIEQIGHVYEGLLDHTAKRATEPVLGFKGSKSHEPEIPLSKLEELKAKSLDEFVAFVSEETGRSEPTLRRLFESPAASTSPAAGDALLLEASGPTRKPRKREAVEVVDENHLLLACQHDRALFQRVRPFAALLREDTLGFPVIVAPGSIYVTTGSDRRGSGTHYTQRSLTEPLVRYTLEPLVYTGPAEGLPKEQWKLKTAREILALKVCDMAMGSGAILVQSCRYLAERLVEAWEDTEKTHPGAFIKTPEGELSTGSPTERLLPQDPAERLAIARRYVADRCLYGVDINPMAVEMAKLSLWLITLQRDRPFTFLDHALKCGDSLLGVSTLKQVENFTLRAKEGEYVEHTFATANLFRYVEEATGKRRDLEALPSNDYTQIETKNRLHAEAEAATAKVKTLADCLIAFELRGLDGEAYDEQRALAADHAEVAMRKSLSEFQAHAREQLRGRRTFHWAVEFPEVFAHGGFDGFVGNPPFMGGQKITMNFGDGYRRFLVLSIASGQRGSADLCAYFVLRAASLSRERGCVGLITTNTIAEGETRQVGLCQLPERGFQLFRGISSQPWPGAAALSVAVIWTTKCKWAGQVVLDGQAVNSITPELSAGSVSREAPKRLQDNDDKAFKGSSIQGSGFLLTPEEALDLTGRDARYKEVLFPYLGGEDITRRPDSSPSRWAINFFNFTLDEAARYPLCLEIVRQKVQPEREKVAARNTIGLRRAQYWWRYDAQAADLYEAVRGLSYVWAAAQTSKYVSIAKQRADIVFSHMTVVFPTTSQALFAVLNSNLHCMWIEEFCATLETRLRYIPTDGFETFPFPQGVLPVAYNRGKQLNPSPAVIRLNDAGQNFEAHRASVMISRTIGLTDTYNLFHSRDEKSDDITRLRAFHVEVDQAVVAAYGWSDLDLGHDFYETKHGVRYTISESARRTVLDKLLTLNHERYAAEVKAGLHDKGAKKTTKPKTKSVSPASTVQPGAGGVQFGLGLALPASAERTLPVEFRLPASDGAHYAVSLVFALLSEAGGSLPLPRLRDAFVLATSPKLMQRLAPGDDAARVKAWAQRWCEAAKPGMFLDSLKAIGSRHLTVSPGAEGRIFQLLDGPRPPANEDVGYDAWIALRIAATLPPSAVLVPECTAWTKQAEELVLT